MPIVEVPGLGDVEFPEGTPRATMEAAIKRALLEGKGQQQPSGPENLFASMGTGFEAPAFQPGPEIPAFVARTAPGLVPAPGIAAPLSAGGEALAQFIEGGSMRPEQIALAAAIPPGAAAVGRLGRGLIRAGTRLIPSAFEKAQRAARGAGEALVEGLRPAEDVAALARSARAGGTDLIPAGNIERIVGEIRLPTTPANPKLAAVKTTIENLRAVLKPGEITPVEEGFVRLYRGESTKPIFSSATPSQWFSTDIDVARFYSKFHGAKEGSPVIKYVDVPKKYYLELVEESRLAGIKQPAPVFVSKAISERAQLIPKPSGKIQLEDLEAIRRDIGPLLQSKNAPAELRGIYGAIVTDLEKEAAGGGVGASLARQVAIAFKQDLGAAKVAELLDKATTRRIIAGADLPALDMGKFSKSIQQSRQQLVNQIGPDAVRTVDEFITRFRSLPPTVAYTGWNSLLAVLSGSAGGFAAGIPGAVALAVAPEVIRNMAAVGANPAALNTVMISVSQGIRAATLMAAPRGTRAGLER